MIKTDKKIMDTLLQVYFDKKLKETSFYNTVYFYMIDYRERQRVKVSKFLDDQVSNPSMAMVDLANSLKKRTRDATVINILQYVKKNFRYKLDQDNYGTTEYWAQVGETIKKKSGDCDDLNSLIYILCRLAEISQSALFCAIGDTFGGGHFWCMYYSFKQSKLVSIDATYYYSGNSVRNRPQFKFSQTKYQRVWALFNDEYSWRLR